MNTPKSFLRISVIFIGLLLSSFVCCASAQDNDILTPVEYKRPPDQTYLTFPEWYIVYSSEEYANTLKHYKPSEFPYLGASKQFWNGYSEVKDLTKAYPYNSDYHTMIKVIGTSMSLEYLLKGLYENSIGRFTEWTRTHGPTSEDKFAYQVAEDYVSFIKIYPWYQFDFASKFKKLWLDNSFFGSDFIRKLERKFFLSAEYGFKAGYAWLIKTLTHSLYGEASSYTIVVSSDIPDKILKNSNIKILKQLPNNLQLVSLPRYDAFKKHALMLAKSHVKFQEIAGNKSNILITILAPSALNLNLKNADIVFTQPILTDNKLKRIAIKTPVRFLSQTLIQLININANIEHVYDY